MQQHLTAALITAEVRGRKLTANAPSGVSNHSTSPRVKNTILTSQILAWINTPQLDQWLTREHYKWQNTLTKTLSSSRFGQYIWLPVFRGWINGELKSKLLEHILSRSSYWTLFRYGMQQIRPERPTFLPITQKRSFFTYQWTYSLQEGGGQR